MGPRRRRVLSTHFNLEDAFFSRDKYDSLMDKVRHLRETESERSSPALPDLVNSNALRFIYNLHKSIISM